MSTAPRDPNAPATPAEMAQLGLSVAASVASSFGPGGMAAGAILTGLQAVFAAATREGRDFTDDEVDGLFDAYAVARAENMAAEEQAPPKSKESL